MVRHKFHAMLEDDSEERMLDGIGMVKPENNFRQWVEELTYWGCGFVVVSTLSVSHPRHKLGGGGGGGGG